MDLEKYIAIVEDWPSKGISFKDITPLMADGAAFKYATEQIVEYAKKNKLILSSVRKLADSSLVARLLML